MGIERERKFLVANDDWRANAGTGMPIRQGYLSQGDAYSVRVRIAGSKACLTVKSAESKESRVEFEYGVPIEDAVTMLNGLSEESIIAKTRYELHHGGRTWTVDVFGGTHAGLVIAEVEFTGSPTIELPSWIGKEVTGNLAYYNATLANSAQEPAE